MNEVKYWESLVEYLRNRADQHENDKEIFRTSLRIAIDGTDDMVKVNASELLLGEMRRIWARQSETITILKWAEEQLQNAKQKIN